MPKTDTCNGARMSGKAAFVIGATGGLGHAACHALARDWDGIAIGYRSSIEKAQSIADKATSEL